nr:LacI family DNA-binding transcriptional regulator [uncultured Actinotalea sp.]
MNATLKEVAERAGVHPGTASRALNPQTQALVSDATVRRVQAAAKALSYRPNSMARGLKTNRTTMVGIVVPDLSNPLFPPIVRGAEEVLSRAGYTCLIADTDNDPRREAESFETLRGRHVDGLIVASAERDDAAVRAVADDGVPIVLINRRTDRVRVPAVMGDDWAGIEQSVRHLVGLGHRSIGHLSGPETLSTGVERARAFRHAVVELGAEDDPDLSEACLTYSVEAGARAARVLLDRAGDRLTAVVAGNDQIAVGLLDVLRERGLVCPRDLSIVGYNDMPFMDKLSPALTTVHVPHEDIGREAAQILVRWLSGENGSPSATTTLPVDLVVRASTAPPRASLGGLGGAGR